MFISAAILLLALSLFLFTKTETWRSEEFRKKMGWQSYGRESHGTYHECEWSRDVVIPRDEEDFDAAVFAGSLPACPSGGEYSLVGDEVVCSHPYHQWYNCMWKTDR
jgi:hypothetical protein